MPGLIRTAICAYSQWQNWDWRTLAPEYDAIIIDVASQPALPVIRAANPRARLYLYADAASARSGAWPLDYDKIPPEWTFGAKRVAFKSYAGDFLLDHAQRNLAETWAINVIDRARGFDGVFLDDVCPLGWLIDLPGPTALGGAAGWIDRVGQFLAIVDHILSTADLKTIANFGSSDVRQEPWKTWLENLDGHFDENWIIGEGNNVDQPFPPADADNQIASLQASAGPTIVQVACEDAALANYAIGCYLIAMTPDSYLAFRGKGSYQAAPPLPDLPVYQGLGKPVRDGLRALVSTGGGVWVRLFEQGAVYVNTSLSPASFKAGAPTIAPRSAMVLLR